MTHPVQHIVVIHFPQHWQAINRLLATDPAFQEICEDYEDAYHALKHWHTSEADFSDQMVASYEQLLKEVAEEIADILQDYAADT